MPSLVCGGSLATIKATHGHVGVTLSYQIVNPFDPPNCHIYWEVCPTHQVCCKINLYCVSVLCLCVAQEYNISLPCSFLKVVKQNCLNMVRSIVYLLL